MDISQVQIIRSRRRTAGIQITRDGDVIFRAPLRMPKQQIMTLLEERQGWIESRLTMVRQANRAGEAAPLSGADLQHLARQASESSRLSSGSTPGRWAWILEKLPSGVSKPDGAAALPKGT